MKEIIKLRKGINKTDKQIIILLRKRFDISKKIGDYKKKKKLKIRDLKREGEIIREKIKKSKLDKIFVKKLYALIFKESRRMQK